MIWKMWSGASRGLRRKGLFRFPEGLADSTGLDGFGPIFSADCRLDGIFRTVHPHVCQTPSHSAGALVLSISQFVSRAALCPSTERKCRTCHRPIRNHLAGDLSIEDLITLSSAGHGKGCLGLQPPTPKQNGRTSAV